MVVLGKIYISTRGQEGATVALDDQPAGATSAYYLIMNIVMLYYTGQYETSEIIAVIFS